MSPKLRHDAKLTQQVFAELNCFVLTFHEEATGRDISRTFCALLEADPGFAAYDVIENLTAFGDEVSHADVQKIAECYAERRVDDGEVRHTVIATPDPNYRFWVPALDHFFPGRRHHVVATLEEAWETLNRLRGR